MSVLIKGMEMPEHCGYCRFRYDGICHALQKTQYRMEECPLIPFPEHGRLIDADNIGLTNFEIILCQEGNPYKNALEMLLKKIENAPTIIEAEEGET